MNAISQSNDSLEILRGLALRARALQGLENEIVFTCDSCGLKNMCRHVYAPGNVGGVCSAADVRRARRYAVSDCGVVKKQPTEPDMVSFSHFDGVLPTYLVEELHFDEITALSGGVE